MSSKFLLERDSGGSEVDSGQHMFIDACFNQRPTSAPVEFRQGCLPVAIAASPCTRFSKQETE